MSETLEIDLRVCSKAARSGQVSISKFFPHNESVQQNPCYILRAYSTEADPSSRIHTTTSFEFDSFGATNHPKKTHVQRESTDIQILIALKNMYIYNNPRCACTLRVNDSPGARLVRCTCSLSSFKEVTKRLVYSVIDGPGDSRDR